MSDLSSKKCAPCEGKTTPLTKDQANELLGQTPGWALSDDGKWIHRQVTAKNFVDAVNLINGIKDIAEAENHHPDIHLTGYKKLKIDLSTHAIGGLSDNDFIVARKINDLFKSNT